MEINPTEGTLGTHGNNIRDIRYVAHPIILMQLETRRSTAIQFMDIRVSLIKPRNDHQGCPYHPPNQWYGHGGVRHHNEGKDFFGKFQPNYGHQGCPCRRQTIMRREGCFFGNLYGLDRIYGVFNQLNGSGRRSRPHPMLTTRTWSRWNYPFGS